MKDEETLSGWARYYFMLILGFVVLGVAVGLGYVGQALQRSESSVVIVETRGRISARNVGPIVSAVFETSAVYEPALEELDLDISSEELYAEHLELLPIPDANTVLVIGRGDSTRQSDAIAQAVSESLVDALNDANQAADFAIFSGPQPAPARRGISQKVAGALGGMTGLWVGLAIGILHYRWKRPVLTFRNALDITEAEHATVVEGRWWRWFGFLRPSPRWKNTPGNQIRLARLVPHAPSPVQVELVGGTARQEVSVARTLHNAVTAGRPRAESDDGSPAHGRQGNGAGNKNVSVVVVHAGTGERDLALARRMLAVASSSNGAGDVALVWVR